MISSEKYVGSKEDFYFFLKDEIIRLFKEKLKIQGTRVIIPEEQLDYEFKYVNNGNSGDFSIKVKWGQKPEEKVDFNEDFNEVFKEMFNDNLKKDLTEDPKEDYNGNSNIVIDKHLSMNNL